jgi:hypothetical protein
MGYPLVAFLCFLWRLPLVDAAFERTPLVPQVLARGGAGVGWTEGNAAFLWNPAAKPPFRAVSQAAYNRPFGVDNLDEGILSHSHRIASHSALGVSWQRLQTDGYHEERQSVAVGHGNGVWRGGVRVDMFGVKIDGFGSQSTPGVSVGGLWFIRDGLQLGAAFDALNRPKIPGPLPRRIAVGVGVQARSDLQLFLDARWIEDVALQILAGGELSLGRHFRLRVGMHNQPWEATGGWGVQVGAILVDYAWINHSSLGDTHQISVSWVFSGE